MLRLPSELLLLCRETLLRCNEFESHRSLLAVFVTSELLPFESSVPDADNLTNRVDLFLDYIQKQELTGGGPVLPYFLAALRDRYQPGNAMREGLDSLYKEIRSITREHSSVQRENNSNEETTNTTIKRMNKDESVDFVIVTALEEERDAILSKLPDHKRQPQTEDDIRVYYSSIIEVPSSNNPEGIYRIIVMPLLGMGRVQATVATADAIRRWRPQYVLMIGIAGGVAVKGVQLGDVLIASQIVDYELQKITPEGPDIQWEVNQTDSRFLVAAQNMRDEEWQSLITQKRPRTGKPKQHVYPIASGDKVIEFSEIMKKLRGVWSKLIGVEMEAAGVATATFQAASRPGFFMIRGVSDLADEKKNSENVKKWREYACDIAAAYLLGLLRCVPIKPSKEIKENGYINAKNALKDTAKIGKIPHWEDFEWISQHRREFYAILSLCGVCHCKTTRVQ